MRLVEGSGVEGNDAVPAAGHRNGEAGEHGVAGGGGAEVGPGGCYGFVAVAVTEGEGVVVLGWFGEVEGAGCCVVAVAGCEEGCDVFGLEGRG